MCGNDVEVGDSYLVEGCWDGPFFAANFLEAENFFGTARDGGPDSGARVARALGLDCVEHDRPSRATEAESEMEFFASGAGTGGDYVIRAFENEIRGAVFLTGFYGDILWSESVAPSRDLIRSDDSGTGLTEFRLRTEFFHVNAPCIGGIQAEDIWRITNSPELASYSLTVSYNKPIARRLIEEAGVPPEWFGQVKRAVTIGFV